jgi:hypothetical protein
VSYQGQRFEVPFELSGRNIKLVVDPHAQRVVGVEDDSGKSLGQATSLDTTANSHRTRRKGTPADPVLGARQGANLVEIALARHHGIKDHGVQGDDAGKGG